MTAPSPLSIGFLTVAPGIVLRYAQARTSIEPARGTVLVIQGRGEFIEKYFEAAHELLKAGYHVVTFDWRGQGLSTRLLENRQKGHIDSYDTYLSDLGIMIDKVIKPLDTRPLYALAHSMGGHILARYLERDHDTIDAAILSAPMIDIAKNGLYRYAFLSLSWIMVRLGLGHRYAFGMRDYNDDDRDFAKNRRTHDSLRFQREVQAITDNPELALGGVTWGWLYATLRSILRLRSARPDGSQRIPMILISAGQEQIVSNPAQHDYAARRPHCILRTLDGAYHEILQESDSIRQEFWTCARPLLQGGHV